MQRLSKEGILILPLRDLSFFLMQCEEMETAKGAAPSGCLQYHTGASGHFASFAFPITASLIGTTKVVSTVTHLNNQGIVYILRVSRKFFNLNLHVLKVVGRTSSIGTLWFQLEDMGSINRNTCFI